MEKQELKSKWDELAREIGAEISPEKEQLVETRQTPAADLPADIAPAKSRATTRPGAPKRPAGWDNLASEFGLPTPEVDVEPVADEVVTVRTSITAEVVEVDAPRRERQPDERQDRSGQGRGARSRDREDSQREPSRERARRPRGGRQRERVDDRPQRPERDARRPRQQREEPTGHEERAEHEASSQRGDRKEREQRQRDERADRHQRDVPRPSDAREEARQTEPADAREETPKPAPAVSLWQKIFGAPAEPAAASSEQAPTEAVESQVAPEHGDESRLGEDDVTRRAHLGEDVAESEGRMDVSAEFEGTAGEDESAEPRQRRPRRRRRGRGGRGDRAADTKSDERSRRRPAHEESVHEDDFDELIPGDEELDQETGGEVADGADNGADGNEDEQRDQNGSVRRRAALQRSIPSWDEAIGYIVESNMQARSQRRQTSHSGGRSGSSRGRPTRGRRKR